MKPGLKKKEDEQVVIENDDLEKNPVVDEGIEIPLDDNGEPIPDDVAKKQQEEAEKAKEEEQRRKNAESAQRRIDQDKQRLRQQLEESNKRIADLEKRSSVSQFGQTGIPQNVVKDKTYWEKRLADDPVGALDEYDDFKYSQRLKQQQDHQERTKMLEGWQITLKESQEMAVEEFPSLDTEGTPEYNMFMDILGKHPDWRNSPIGPMKVVREMKKLMADGSGGNDVISKARSEAETNERNRQNRIVNQPLSNKRPSNSGNKVVLTKEQMSEWQGNFKDRGVTLERYAQMVKRSQGGNTEVTI